MHGKAFLVGEGLSVKRQQGSYASTPCTIPNRSGTPGKAKSTINEYIKNVFEEGELVPEEVMRKIGISEFSINPTNL
ncbi:hypothetical protein [Pseudomonas brassicacearum]|uniref:hypothetical protein n=1 Tax=Pseudomonas brassicacearum TaxID=930166 RepID=UPI000720BC09|nr:hypothetical protein [Pseudomonas brassicacearum]ALQ05948.1 hypothetical protein AK973_5499 [Pseudomonas brassicacearum]